MCRGFIAQTSRDDLSRSSLARKRLDKHLVDRRKLFCLVLHFAPLACGRASLWRQLGLWVGQVDSRSDYRQKLLMSRWSQIPWSRWSFGIRPCDLHPVSGRHLHPPAKHDSLCLDSCGHPRVLVVDTGGNRHQQPRQMWSR